jgi:archaemetzincin
MKDDYQTIFLASINHYTPPYWQNIREDLRSRITFPFSYVDIDIDLKLFYSIKRDQYHSTLILSKILNYLPANAEKIIGITGVDIFTPILTFLFGEAQLGGRGAIVSTYRLRNEFYGLPKDIDLLYTRTLKEALHELGHTLGLVHCPLYECVMHFSTYVEDIDLKKSHFCTACQNMLSRT